jgi:hypothetical protein
MNNEKLPQSLQQRAERRSHREQEQEQRKPRINSQKRGPAGKGVTKRMNEDLMHLTVADRAEANEAAKENI